jgi:hypothetical protein
MTRPFQSVPSSPPPIFDGRTVMTWRVDMSNDVTEAVMKNVVPGLLYVFIIVQNGAGGHNFTWPANCVNAAPVDQDPNSTTVQKFIGDNTGTLHASIPGTWF